MTSILEKEKALQEQLKALEDDSDWDSDESVNDTKKRKSPNAKTSLSAKNGNKEKVEYKGKKDRKVKHSLIGSNSSSNNLDTQQEEESSVLFFGRLDKNMQEHELEAFLKQFGEVKQLCLKRSAKTGRSREFAYVRMETPAIANIVAEAMNGYILFGKKRLICHVVPSDKTFRSMFIPVKKQVKQKLPQEYSLNKIKLITNKLVYKEKKRRKAIKAAGIDYDFPGYIAGLEKDKKVDDTPEAENKVASTPEKNHKGDNNTSETKFKTTMPATEKKQVSKQK